MQAKALYQNTMFDYDIVRTQKVGQEVILKRKGGWGGAVALFIFNFFKVYHFYL